MGRQHWLFVISLFCVGCAADPGDRPLTAAEKQRMLDEQAASEDLKGRAGVGDRCAGSTGVVRMEARSRQYNTVEGFNTRGCGP